MEELTELETLISTIEKIIFNIEHNLIKDVKSKQRSYQNGKLDGLKKCLELIKKTGENND